MTLPPRAQNALAVGAFYHRGPDGTFDATDATTSPWDPRMQHGGPPLALIAHIVDERFGNAMAIGRITMEIFGPIPKPGLSVETRALRPGKRIELIEARLRAGGKDIIVANVWRFARLPEGTVPAAQTPAPPAPALPGPETRMEMWDRANGYFRAFEWRAQHGSSRALGPAAVWCRTDLALIAGERREPRDTLLAIADSANGVSLELPLEAWLSIPSSVTLTLSREPTGEWAWLDAATQIGPDGRGVTTGILGDESGPIGNVVQALLVSPR